MSFIKLSATKLVSVILSKKVIGIIAYALIVIFIINLIFPFPWFTMTSRIGKFDSEPGVSISPDRDKMFIFRNKENGDQDITLYNIKTKEKSTFYHKAKENVESEFIGWYDDEQYLITEMNDGVTNYLVTKDFDVYKLLYTVPKGAFEKLSPNGKKLIVQDESIKKLTLYEDGKEVWSTDKYYDRYIISWSDDERYVILTEKLKEGMIISPDGQSITDIKTPDVPGLYLFDTINRSIVKMNNYSDESIGIWAPNKAVFTYSITNTADVNEKGLYFYNVIKQELEKFSLSNIDAPLLVEDLKWSPDGRFIAIIAMDAIYTYDTQAEQNPLKLQFRVNADTSIDSYQIQWVKDSKKILFTIRQTTMNFLKPADYYVAKVDIISGKIKKRFIRASLHDDLFRWLDENEVIYTQNGNKLYRTKLIW